MYEYQLEDGQIIVVEIRKNQDGSFMVKHPVTGVDWVERGQDNIDKRILSFLP